MATEAIIKEAEDVASAIAATTDLPVLSSSSEIQALIGE